MALQITIYGNREASLPLDEFDFAQALVDAADAKTATAWSTVSVGGLGFYKAIGDAHYTSLGVLIDVADGTANNKPLGYIYLQTYVGVVSTLVPFFRAGGIAVKVAGGAALDQITEHFLDRFYDMSPDQADRIYDIARSYPDNVLGRLGAALHVFGYKGGQLVLETGKPLNDLFGNSGGGVAGGDPKLQKAVAITEIARDSATGNTIYSRGDIHKRLTEVKIVTEDGISAKTIKDISQAIAQSMATDDGSGIAAQVRITAVDSKSGKVEQYTLIEREDEALLRALSPNGQLPDQVLRFASADGKGLVTLVSDAATLLVDGVEYAIGAILAATVETLQALRKVDYAAALSSAAADVLEKFLFKGSGISLDVLVQRAAVRTALEFGQQILPADSNAPQGGSLWQLEGFQDRFLSNLNGLIAGAISQKIGFSATEQLGLSGFLGELTQVAGDAAIYQGIRGFFDLVASDLGLQRASGIFGNGFSLSQKVTLNGKEQTVGQHMGTMVLDAVGAHFGTKAATSMLHIDSLNDQIGVTIGSTAGAYIGSLLPLPPGVGSAIGSFIGSIIGEFIFDQILDDFLGIEIRWGNSSQRPLYYIHPGFDGQYVYKESVTDKKDTEKVKPVVEQMWTLYSGTINTVLKAVDGTVDRQVSGVTTFGYSHHDRTQFTAVTSMGEHKSANVDYLLKLAIITDLVRLSFTSGDVLAIAALERWQSHATPSAAYDLLRSSVQVPSALAQVTPTRTGFAFTADAWLSSAKDALDLEWLLKDPDASLAKLAEFFGLAQLARAYVDDPEKIRSALRDQSKPVEAALLGNGLTASVLDLGVDRPFNVIGSLRSDRFATGSFADVVGSGDGDDEVSTFAGDDTVYAGSGNDVVDGGAGRDLLGGDSGNDRLTGGDGDDSLFGGADDDTLYGGPGADLLLGDQGNDIAYGDAGRDVLFGYLGSDKLFGGDDPDEMNGGPGNDMVDGGRGNDIVWGDEPGDTGDDTLFGREGDDYLKGGAGNDTIFGGPDDDFAEGDDGDDVVLGEAGNDSLRGGAGADELDGGSGDDILRGEAGPDVLRGGSGADHILGGSENDRLDGGDGDDQLTGDTGNDVLVGGAGKDLLDGWRGNDDLDGGDGDDTISGGDGPDIVRGGSGNDVLFGDRLPGLASSRDQDARVIAATEARIGASSFAVVYSGDSYNLESLRATDNEMLVIPAGKSVRIGTPASEVLWTSAEIASLQSSGKLVIGYLNMAITNDYLREWSASWTSDGLSTGQVTPIAPSFLQGSSIVGGHGRLVNFSDPQWLGFLKTRVDKIVAAGFNGIFLDDVLQYFSVAPATNPSAIAQAAVAMRDLVTSVSEYASQVAARTWGQAFAEQFTVVVNGAAFLIADTGTQQDPASVGANDHFYRAIDAFVAENYFSGNLDYAVVQAKQEYGSRGIALLSVDTHQGSEQERIETVKKAVAAGFLPYTVPDVNYDALSPAFVPGYGDVEAPENDILIGGPGDDIIDGGAGVDVARYLLPRASYAISKDFETWTVRASIGDEGADLLNSMERIQFSDLWVALDINGAAGWSARTVTVLYGKSRLDDEATVGRVLAQLDVNSSIPDAVARVLRLPDAKELLALANADYVRTLYRNVVGAEPDRSALAYYQSLLETGAYTRASLAAFAVTVPESAAMADLVGLASTGLEYTPG